jgi:MoaA/NifB/PqqE/SkfB family radical SAM enzyme
MHVVLMVNSKCNKQCKHCYLPYTGFRTPTETLKTIDELQKDNHTITIAGSETLLDTDYLAAYKKIGQNYLLTNGILLNDNPLLYNLLQEAGIEKLIFSIHFGISDELNSVSENLVAKVIQESKKLGFKIQITTTITQENYCNISEMCEKSIQYEADILQFNRLILQGNSPLNDMKTLTEKQIEIFFQQILACREVYPKEILYIKPQGNFGPRPGSKGELLSIKNEYCPAGKNLVAIDPQNRVYSCPFLMTPNNIIGKYENGHIIIEQELSYLKRNTCLTIAMS